MVFDRTTEMEHIQFGVRKLIRTHCLPENVRWWSAQPKMGYKYHIPPLKAQGTSPKRAWKDCKNKM